MEETWWWNKEVQAKIKEKKETFKKWQRTDNSNAKAIYVTAKMRAKREVAKNKTQSMERMVREIGNK